MDCNSYSYAPHMLDGEDETLDHYENVDMEISVYKYRHYSTYRYDVLAYSYDGQLEVAETFTSEATARRLYLHIMRNYTDTPPDMDVLNEYIQKLKKGENNG